MLTRTAVVASSVGLHARPASVFAQTAAQSGIAITLTAGSGISVNAASILGVLSLAIGHGDTVTLSAAGEGTDADRVAAALDALVNVLTMDFDAK